MLPTDEILALHDVCESGLELATQVLGVTEKTSSLNVTTGQLFDAEGYLKDVLPKLNEEGRTKAQLRSAVFRLASEAYYDLVGPVPEQELSREEKFQWDMRHTAIGAVEAAFRELGPEAKDGDVIRKAIKLMDDNIEGEVAMTGEEREEYVEMAIERLVEARDYPYGILDRMKEGRRPLVRLV